MKGCVSRLAGIALIALCSSAARAETDTVLLCFGTNVMRFAVEDGVWSAQGDFAHNALGYGGKTNVLQALASDGRRVFVGDSGSRVLEFDLAGNYLRTLATGAKSIEHMCMSQDGDWVYATAGIVLNSPTTNAVVYRYNAVTGEGGIFVPNEGTNALGEVLWKLQALRGVATDGERRLWVSNRNTGEIFLFSEADGTYLGKVTGLTSVQALYYAPQEDKVYGSASSANTYVVDTATLAVTAYSITGLNNRLGITQVQGSLCSGRWDTPDISRYDLASLTSEVVADVPKNSRQIITLPRAPIRAAIGRLLVSETVSNRVSSLAVDTRYVVEREGTFAGGEGASYGGTPLRSPCGLASFSNTVYVAEGVAGGRILKFSKWGTFKSVVLDFSQTAIPECVPAALALAPDGQTLYVTDARTLFIAGNGVASGNLLPNGYYNTHGYGEAIYKVGLPARTVSVFADSASVSNVAAGYMLLDPRGVAVDGNGSVYCSSWYNKTNALYNSTGSVYQFDSSGVRQAAFTAGNPSICYYDPAGTYVPATADPLISGPGVLHVANGVQDIFWTASGMASRIKLLNLNDWRGYLDLEVVDGRLWFTDPEYGTLWRRTGDGSAEAALTGLFMPTYLAYAPETGAEPPPPGTLMMAQ